MEPALLLTALFAIPIALFCLFRVKFSKSKSGVQFFIVLVFLSLLTLAGLGEVYRRIDVARLWLWGATYDATMAFTEQVGQSRVALRSWGDNGMFGSATIYTLVYDETGEIAIPTESRSPLWRNQVEEHLGQMVPRGCHATTRHAWGAYFIITAVC